MKILNFAKISLYFSMVISGQIPLSSKTLIFFALLQKGLGERMSLSERKRKSFVPMFNRGVNFRDVNEVV